MSLVQLSEYISGATLPEPCTSAEQHNGHLKPKRQHWQQEFKDLIIQYFFLNFYLKFNFHLSKKKQKK